LRRKGEGPGEPGDAGNFGGLRVDGERRGKENEGKTDGGEVRDKPPTISYPRSGPRTPRIEANPPRVVKPAGP